MKPNPTHSTAYGLKYTAQYALYGTPTPTLTLALTSQTSSATPRQAGAHADAKPNVTFYVGRWYCWTRAHSRSLSTWRPRRRRRSRTPPCRCVCSPRCARRIATARAPSASWRPQGVPTCRTGNARHTPGKDRSLPLRAGRPRSAPSACATARRGSWPRACGATSSPPARAPACWAARVPRGWAVAAAPRAAPCARPSRGRSTLPSSTTGGGTRRATYQLAGPLSTFRRRCARVASQAAARARALAPAARRDGGRRGVIPVNCSPLV